MSAFYQDKKVLVAGGTGFFGTHVVEQLLAAGADVRVTVHKRRPMVDEGRIEVFEADLTRLDECIEACRGVDYVFNCAGGVGAAGLYDTNPISSVTNTLVTGVRVLEGAWTAGVKRLLMFSSSTGYPAFEHPVREDEFWAGDPHECYLGYGWMKRYLEKLFEFAGKKSQMKLAVIRPTALYGPYDNYDLASCHVIPALIRKAVERWDPYEVWGDGSQVRDFLHAADLARASLMVLEHKADCEPVNIGYGKAVTIKEVVGIILDAAGYGGANVKFLPDKPIAIPVRAVNIDKARSELGFEPQISLEEGIRETVGWYSGIRKQESGIRNQE